MFIVDIQGMIIQLFYVVDDMPITITPTKFKPALLSTTQRGRKLLILAIRHYKRYVTNMAERTLQVRAGVGNMTIDLQVIGVSA